MATYDYNTTIANSISAIEGVLSYVFVGTLNSNSSIPADDPIGEIIGYAVNSNSSIIGDLVYGKIGDLNSNSSIIPSTIYTISTNTILNSNSSVAVDYEQISVLVDLACYVLNLDTRRVYEWDNYQFLGYGRLNNVFMGVKAAGIYDLETTATDDDGSNIAASLTFKTDFGLPNHKQLRNIFCDANIKVTITDESNNDTVITSLTANEFRGLKRALRDRWLKIKIENINGDQVEIRRIMGKLNILGIKGD